MKPYYEERGITIFHASYQDVLPSIKPKSVGLLLTDPPYGTTDLKWDKPVDWKLFWPIVEQICKCYANYVLFSSGLFTHTLIASNRNQFRYELIWEKPMPVGFLSANRRPLRAHENILIFNASFKRSIYNAQLVKGPVHVVGKVGTLPGHYGNFKRMSPRVTDRWHPRSILRFSKPLGQRSLHPTQKPLELTTWLVRSYSHPRNLVLDPFVGSGTTLVAAKKTGRRAIGIDANEQFCEIAAKRLQQEVD
ncbi:MAG TPA: site-specific DNA-methyltransferase [Pyrinomonadaceae bacterium]|nr:site-specific DNA-methyltransferase [Pyrinomonadaceae bacterium]